MRDPDVKVLRRGSEMVVMTPEIRDFMREPTLLIVIKANVSSRVHRRIRMDYVGIKLYTPDGRLEGEIARRRPFHLGRLYPLGAADPLCPPQGFQVLARAGFDPSGHSGKALMHILEEYPRDELFQIDVDTLNNFVMEILILYERPRVRALARVDKFDRFVSILVFIPREKYDTNVRSASGFSWRRPTRVSVRLLRILPEGPLARVHYIIGRYEGKTPVVERATLEAEISAIAAYLGRQAEGRARGVDRWHAGAHAHQPLRPGLLGGLYRGFRRNRRSPISRPSKSSRSSGDDFGSPHRGRGRSSASA